MSSDKKGYKYASQRVSDRSSWLLLTLNSCMAYHWILDLCRRAKETSHAAANSCSQTHRRAVFRAGILFIVAVLDAQQTFGSSRDLEQTRVVLGYTLQLICVAYTARLSRPPSVALHESKKPNSAAKSLLDHIPGGTFTQRCLLEAAAAWQDVQPNGSAIKVRSSFKAELDCLPIPEDMICQGLLADNGLNSLEPRRSELWVSLNCCSVYPWYST